ncbi:MAG TPA: alginate export family protein [Geminicoccus sp.]|uniref:alginate export family protein n=1 Tax=Geminicoccus sp. TaxID=2024832 RepID=UPI002E336E01|nr:alginate export family protein [Geminicoccus sp.]HEX2524788.1 alginate export family protein [Geminicoccus sp.]
MASGITAGWEGKPPPTQQDQLDLLQAFAELRLPVGGGDLMLRGGRQEMSFGASRLVSVRESPNIRRAFDGIRTSWVDSQDQEVDAFLVRPVAPRRGSFNDSSDQSQAFWGIYGTAAFKAVPNLHYDLYYFGLESDDAEYAQGIATEHRHTIGTRLFGEWSSFDWDLEAAFQFGTFGDADIRAWTVSSDIGYTISSWPFSPRLGLKADAISGDDDLRDDRLGTFNPLFPKLPYFSEANLAAPANLLDLQPNLTLPLTPEVELGLGWNPLWKQANADAFYAPPMTPVENTAGGSSSSLGQQFITSIEWAATAQLTVGGTYVYFTPGDRLEEAGGQSGQFTALWAKFLF